jgi:periplasmic protein TonB
VLLRPYYRNYELPWEREENDEFFRKLWLISLAVTLVLGIILWLLPRPEVPIDLKPSVPPRLAKIVIEKEIPPPPPPPVVEPDKPKPEEKPPERVAERPKPNERPDLARTQNARERATKAGILAFEDQFKDIRQQFDVTKEQLQQTANTTGEVDGPSRAERSLITSKAGSASTGINTAGQSRGFGGGSGNLGGASSTRMQVPFGGSGSGSALAGGGRGDGVERSGRSGKASRSREEIETIFDRNKGAIYALYGRALRDQPELQGKLVLEFTISPAGEVTMCRIVSSDLKDPELERKIVARVRLFRFESKDVETITTTKPIDFFPA